MIVPEELPEASGIYCITHVASGMRYVGLSKNIRKRMRAHLHHTKCDERDTYIYNALRKYGAAEFEIEVLEFCSVRALKKREQHWIAVNDCIAPRGYNLTRGGDVSPMTNPAVAAKMGATMRRRFAEEPDRRVRQAAAIRNAYADPVVRARMVALTAAARNAPAVRAKISSGLRRAYENDPTLRAKNGAAQRKRFESAEARAAISAAQRKNFENPQARAKLSAALREAYENDPALRANIAATWRDPTVKAARTTRHAVEVAGQQHSSFKAACLALGLDLASHTKARKAMKRDGSVVFRGHTFTLAQKDAA